MDRVANRPKRFDQNDLTNSTINIIGTYSRTSGDSLDVSNDLRSVTPIYYDRNNSKIYYQRGQAGVTTTSELRISKYDLSTDTYDVEFFDSYVEGNIENFIFDYETEKLKALFSTYNKSFVNTYDLVYFEFDFGGTGSLTFTSSNSIAGYRITIHDIKEVGNDKIEVVFSPRSLFGTQNRPEFSVNNIYKTLFNKNLDTLQIK